MADHPLLLADPPVAAVPAGVTEDAPSGLASKVSATRFLAAAREALGKWEGLAVDERVALFVDAVNAELVMAGVPLVDARLAARSTLSPGRFESEDWTMDLSEIVFGADKIGPETAERVAMTVYHEARHAEEFFLMARWRAGKGEPVAKIVGELEVPGSIAVLAAGAPELATDEAARAEVWNASRTGPGRAYQLEVYAANAAISKALAAASAVEGVIVQDRHAPRGAPAEARRVVTALESEFDAVHELVVSLPLESDAWEATRAVDAGFDGTIDQE